MTAAADTTTRPDVRTEPIREDRMKPSAASIPNTTGVRLASTCSRS